MPKTITTEVHFTFQVWKYHMDRRGGAEKAEYSDSLLFLNLLVEGFDFLLLSLLPALDLPLKKKISLVIYLCLKYRIFLKCCIILSSKMSILLFSTAILLCNFFYKALLLSLVPQQFPDVCCRDSVLETFLWVPSGPKLFIFCIWTLASISSKFGFEIQTQFSWNDSIDFHVVLLSTRSTSNGPLYW